MGTTEADQGICGVAKADKSAANFQIQIALWRTRHTNLPKIGDSSKEEDERNPPNPEEKLPTTEDCKFVPFSGQKISFSYLVETKPLIDPHQRGKHSAMDCETPRHSTILWIGTLSFLF